MVLLAVRGAGFSEANIFNVYSMVYDSKTRGNNGLGQWLGKFEVIQQIVEDYWQDTFIGENVDSGEVCLIMAHEVCGTGGGIAYEVFQLQSLRVARLSDE